MSTSPRLSIIIPVYNAEQTLPRTIKSLEWIDSSRRSQVEVLLIDDGSQDNSWEALQQSISSDQHGFQWQTFQQTNAGAGAARNVGLLHARGNWVQFLDADDELQTDLTCWIEKYPQASCIGFSLDYYKQGKRISHVRPVLLDSQRQFWNRMTAENLYQSSCLVFRREAVLQQFQEGIDCVDDWLFWLRNEQLFERMVIEPGVVSTRIHMHGGNISAQYRRVGENRSLVANIVLEAERHRLTCYQKNNLQIQQAIGNLQQRKCPELSAFIRWPCQFKLYVKLWIYLLAAVLQLQATRY